MPIDHQTNPTMRPKRLAVVCFPFDFSLFIEADTNMSRRSLEVVGPICVWIACLLPVCAAQAQDRASRQ